VGIKTFLMTEFGSRHHQGDRTLHARRPAKGPRRGCHEPHGEGGRVAGISHLVSHLD